MYNKVLSRLNRLEDKKRYTILTCPTHEGYQSMLSNTGHDFYMLSGEGVKNWDFHTRKLPPRHYIYTQDYNQMRGYQRFDFILSQNKSAQWPLLEQISQQLNIPIITLEHTEPPPGASEKQLEELKERRGYRQVFITEYNKNSWDGQEDDVVIHHGIDTELFQGWSGYTPKGLSIVNHFANRDVFCGWNLWRNIVGSIPVQLIGDNPDLNTKSINDPQELVQTIAAHRFFLNTSQLSPIPLSLLEAMAVGCPPVTTAQQEIPKVIENGVNGYISNDPEELKSYCEELIMDSEKAKQLGMAARETIKEKFSMDAFVEKWNNLFDSVYEETR